MGDSERQLHDILQTLTEDQLRFVAERLSCRTDLEAAERCGLSKHTVYGWDNKQAINDAVMLARLDCLNVARERLRRMAGKALDVLGEEMDGKGRNAKKLEAALAVLDRAGLVVVSKIEQRTESSGDLIVRVEYVDADGDAGPTKAP